MKKPIMLFGLISLVLFIVFSVEAEESGKDTAVPPTESIPTITNIAQLSAPAQRYIVQFSAPPVAAVHSVAQKPAAAEAYRAYVAAQQSTFLTSTAMTLGRPLQPLYQYDAAFNGMTLLLKSDEVALVAEMAGVTAVYPDQEETILTDVGPTWIGAPTIWNGSSVPNSVGNRGEGIIVGIIDTGINMDHPSFAQVGEDGYVHQNPFGAGNFKGACDPSSGQYNAKFVCNNKLIGAWDFADGFGESDGPEDNNGHGSHTASTAAGNVVTATVTVPSGYHYKATISGVAPHANIIAYDVCVFTCFQSSLLAAINQAVLDGVDVLNYSISGGSSPYSDPISQAFLTANAAGIFVSAAAGNEGPGASTLSHQEPWVMTVGAMTHDRAFANTLKNMGGGASVLADIVGNGITGGYGPAPIVYAGNFGDPLCLNNFPPNTFTNEIVICDRGVNARIEKGNHVLAGGAKGMVLANGSTDGATLIGDAYSLPAVHITYTDGVALKAWLATGANHMATISGTTAVSNFNLADRMAGFSSRGPNTAMDVIKPDITGPGVDILAAVQTIAPLAPPEYGLKSGTSMAAPHLAGAAALLRKVHPTWTPDEIRSALMMTTKTANLFEDNGVYLADLFDRGAGRVDLSRAAKAGLVLHETLANYAAAQTGDPTTLNLPSMAESSCFANCIWTRTVRNVLDQSATWTVTAVTNNGLQIETTPSQFTLASGAFQSLQIEANVTQLAGTEWQFATVVLSSPGQESLQMPMAVRKRLSTNPSVLSKTGPNYAEPNQIITYEISLDNLDNMTHTFKLTDTLPLGVTYVPNSATSGLVYDEINKQLTWEGEMGLGTMGYDVTAVDPPLPYINLGDLSNPPNNLCALFTNCDDGLVQFDLSTNGVSYTFYDETLSDIYVSANGVLMGPEGFQGMACSACPQPLPVTAELNQVLAGLWRDMDASTGVGQWYAALLDDWLPGSTVFYANWHDVGQYGDPFTTSRHGIAVVLDGQLEPNGRIYYIYDTIPNPAAIVANGYTVGVENKWGTAGETVAFAPCADAICVQGSPVGSVPNAGTTLRLDPAIVGGPSAKIFTYQVQVNAPVGTLLTNTVEVATESSLETVTAVADVFVEYRRYFPIVFR